ncbi:uncharacterized protein LOC123921353 isoform X4 [Trifolium pratense]|uniref:uncharacterized protein LOC123921353 isoform X4 n=1 Tax=Trifolium pratense TaxID=57577 RepID=UPI001E6963F3|nr:uncharacterized protein LOC123921353 isoform X4 [Trifolium pratense]
MRSFSSKRSDFAKRSDFVFFVFVPQIPNRVTLKSQIVATSLPLSLSLSLSLGVSDSGSFTIRRFRFSSDFTFKLQIHSSSSTFKLQIHSLISPSASIFIIQNKNNIVNEENELDFGEICEETILRRLRRLDWNPWM